MALVIILELVFTWVYIDLVKAVSCWLNDKTIDEQDEGQEKV